MTDLSTPRAIYAAFRKSPPKSRGHGLGAAYYDGFERPDEPPTVNAGMRGSQAYAAWRAGRDNKRAATKATETTTQPTVSTGGTTETASSVGGQS